VTSNRKDRNRTARLNDALRKRPPTDGRTLISERIVEKGSDYVLLVMERVAKFNGFTRDNDPDGNHEFGCLDVEGEILIWKIGYTPNSSEVHSCFRPPPNDLSPL
jgi:Protein of unknown function (DUF3768)